jgi:hypothetical protein
MNRPAEELKKKTEYLLAALRREKQKMAKSKITGQGRYLYYCFTVDDVCCVRVLTGLNDL